MSEDFTAAVNAIWKRHEDEDPIQRLLDTLAHLKALDEGPEANALHVLETLSRRLLELEGNTSRLAQSHDALRVRFAKQAAALLKANQVVGKAALTHRDTRLAELARDTLHGQPYEDAKSGLPTGVAILRGGW